MSGAAVRRGLQEYSGGDHELKQAEAEQDDEVGSGFMVIMRQNARPVHTSELPTVQTRKQAQKRRRPSCFFLSPPEGFQPSRLPRVASQYANRCAQPEITWTAHASSRYGA